MSQLITPLSIREVIISKSSLKLASTDHPANKALLLPNIIKRSIKILGLMFSLARFKYLYGPEKNMLGPLE